MVQPAAAAVALAGSLPASSPFKCRSWGWPAWVAPAVWHQAQTNLEEPNLHPVSRFMSHRLGALGASWILLWVAVALVAAIRPDGSKHANQHAEHGLLSPGTVWEDAAGATHTATARTNSVGTCSARSWRGSGISLSVGAGAVLISLILGLLLGGVAGYFGGWADRLIVVPPSDVVGPHC